MWRNRKRQVLRATFYRCLSPGRAKRRRSGRARKADLGAAFSDPPGEAQRTRIPSRRAAPRRMVCALEDRVKSGRLTCNRRSGPARGLGVPRRPSPAAPVPRAGPRAIGWPSPSCSPPALRGGGAAAIYIQGKPAELAPRPWTRPSGGANGAGAQPTSPRGRGPRSGQSEPQERGAGQQRGDAPSAVSPTPPSPERTWSQDCCLLPVSHHHLPEEEIVPRCLLGWMPGIRICYSRSCRERGIARRGPQKSVPSNQNDPQVQASDPRVGRCGNEA